MRIINTFDNIGSCFPQGHFHMEAWRKYAGNISPNLAEKCEADAAAYDFQTDIVPVAEGVIRHKEKSAQASRSFLAVAQALAAGMGRLFQDEIPLDIIFYLGLCNGAGWATTLDGRDAILLGVEKIVELNWQDTASMQALIYHEIGHIWHKTYGNSYPSVSSQGDASLIQLYREGIAMVCEQLLCQDDSYFHQDQDGWLDWCLSHKDEIKAEYLRRMDKGESTQDFFGGWNSYQGHSDLGYFLGCEFIKYLQNLFSLTQIAKLDASQLRRYYRLFALKE
jgi:hypothetical protein